MKQVIGILLILIGASLVFIMKAGAAKETSVLFTYGDWPLLIAALVGLIPGLIIYKKTDKV